MGNEQGQKTPKRGEYIMIINLLSRAMMMSTPLLLGSLSEVFAERTGVMVTAIEGIFLMGAWAGFTASYLTGSLVWGLLYAALSGLLVAMLYAYIVVTLKTTSDCYRNSNKYSYSRSMFLSSESGIRRPIIPSDRRTS